MTRRRTCACGLFDWMPCWDEEHFVLDADPPRSKDRVRHTLRVCSPETPPPCEATE